MKVEELFLESAEFQQLNESVAVARIRRKAKQYNEGGRRPTIITYQSPKNPQHYTVMVHDPEDGHSTFEMKDRRMVRPVKSSRREHAKMISNFELEGWNRVDTRSWVEKNRVGLIGMAIGTTVMGGFAAAGAVAVMSVVAPIIANFISMFGNFMFDNAKNPFGYLGGGEDTLALPSPSVG